MSKITDYFNGIQITALAHPSVVSVEKIRETGDQKENIGVYQYRIYMKNGDIMVKRLLSDCLLVCLMANDSESKTAICL